MSEIVKLNFAISQLSISRNAKSDPEFRFARNCEIERTPSLILLLKTKFFWYIFLQCTEKHRKNNFAEISIKSYILPENLVNLSQPVGTLPKCWKYLLKIDAFQDKFRPKFEQKFQSQESLLQIALKKVKKCWNDKRKENNRMCDEFGCILNDLKYSNFETLQLRLWGGSCLFRLLCSDQLLP